MILKGKSQLYFQGKINLIFDFNFAGHFIKNLQKKSSVPEKKFFYSPRKTIAGSTFVAIRTGIKLATPVTKIESATEKIAIDTEK